MKTFHIRISLILTKLINNANTVLSLLFFLMFGELMIYGRIKDYIFDE